MENVFEDDAPNDIENPSTPLLTRLRLELKTLPPVPAKWSIYRVPKRLRHVNKEKYTPQVVSIGPLHHGKESLKEMEDYKKRYLSAYLKNKDVPLEECIKIIKDKEEQLRRRYAEPIPFSSDEFVSMVLVDAAFIIEVLLRNYQPEGNHQEVLLRNYQDEALEEHDPIFGKPRMIRDIQTDLQLLENQLPFFILEDLFKIRISVSSEDDDDNDQDDNNHDDDDDHGAESLSIKKLSYWFFKDLIDFEETDANLEQILSAEVEHFVDFIRKFYVPLAPAGKKKLENLNIPTTTELHQAGVNFKVRYSSRNLFDIKFSKGTLEIPKLTIDDRTELTVRNLLAFEQCHCTENYMNAYITILDYLVNSPEDVDLLVKYGIVENHLGDCSQVATLINKLGDGVFWDTDDFYFAEISEKLCAHCRTPWNKWKANLKQKYFNTPWASISVIVAVVLIVLTIIQTVYSII